jgi:hypothetical protein
MPSLRQNSLPLSLRSVVVEFVTLKIYATGGSLVLKFPSSYGPVHLDLATKVYVLVSNGLAHGSLESLLLHFRWVLGPPGNLVLLRPLTQLSVDFFFHIPACSAGYQSLE